MVDLAKIRKKKAEGRRQKAEVAAEPEPASQQPSNPATEQPRDLETPRPRNPEKLERFMAEAGKKREGFIREVAQPSVSAGIEVLTFVLAGEQYAVNIERIVEIIRPRAMTRVPNAGANVVGIVSLRGLIVTIVDVRARLHHPPAGGGNDTRIIVVEHAGETLGFQVDRVLRVVKLDAAAVEAHPVIHSSEQTEAIRGVFQHAGALTILLDLDKLLA
jgi:purine-binding chemotaxis protein CheW